MPANLPNQCQRFCFVTHGPTLDNAPHAWVGLDHQGSVEQATRTLTKLGHRRIRFIHSMVHMTFAHLREEGFRNALNGAGMPQADCPIHSTEMTGESGRDGSVLGHGETEAGQLCEPPLAS